MTYFGMSQKQERGRPIGMLSMALYDKCYSETEAKGVEYGLFPWYANPSLGRPHEPFPPGLCLVVKELPHVDFDIRGDSKFFHIVSEKFVEVMNRLGAEFADAQPINLRDPVGRKIAEKQYWATKFKRVEIADALDMGQSELFPRKDRIKKFRMRSDFSLHAFQLRGMAPGHDTVFCSEHFVRLASDIDFKGVDFLPLDANASGAFTQI